MQVVDNGKKRYLGQEAFGGVVAGFERLEHVVAEDDEVVELHDVGGGRHDAQAAARHLELTHVHELDDAVEHVERNRLELDDHAAAQRVTCQHATAHARQNPQLSPWLCV